MLVIGLAEAESYTCSQGYVLVCVCGVHMQVCVCLFRVNSYLDSGVSEEMGILARVRTSCEMATLHTNALLCPSLCLFVYVCICVCVCVFENAKLQSGVSQSVLSFS